VVVRGVIVLTLACFALGGASSGLADGDPASDTLIVQNVFFPYPTPSSSATSALSTQVSTSYARGYRVKVAVIASANDLGSVPSLFNKPTEYAQFLGQELQFYYVGPLLIVMPSGFGIYDGGRSTAAEETVLARLKVSGSEADALTASATTAVTKMLAAGALKSKDIKPPYVAALDSSGTLGQKIRLNYAAFDDSGKTREAIAVRAGTKVLFATKTKLRATRADKTYFVMWPSPKTVPAAELPLKFCVVAYDPSGHKSTPNCLQIQLK
jgi:hypothetical protein